MQSPCNNIYTQKNDKYGKDRQHQVATLNSFYALSTKAMLIFKYLNITSGK